MPLWPGTGEEMEQQDQREETRGENQLQRYSTENI